MAKSVGMARLAVRRWMHPEGWHWTYTTWTMYQNARRYLRHHAQRRTQ